MIFTDTHAHLHFQDYAGDVDAALQRAYDGGVRYIVNVGTHLECSRRAASFAEKYPNVFASAGCHPHDSKDFSEEELPLYRQLLSHPKVVAIGEVGLDFFRNLSSPEIQEKVFRHFIGLHRETGLPLIMHIRDAHADTFRILEEELKPPIRGVLHCFSGDRAVLEKAVSLGLWISFAGNVTYKKNEFLREVLPFVPKDKIVLETDSPFLPPEGFRGKRNEPAYLVAGAGLVAKLMGVSFEDLAEMTTRNAVGLFGFQT